MSYRKSQEQGRHCSRGVLALALLGALPQAWSQSSEAQDAPQPQAAQATNPAPEQASRARLKLYLGNSAKELLSDTQWETLLAMQSPEPAENPDLNDNAEVVDVKGERPAPQVPDGIAALFWAVRHPAQAWRIFAPIPP